MYKQLKTSLVSAAIIIIPEPKGYPAVIAKAKEQAIGIHSGEINDVKLDRYKNLFNKRLLLKRFPGFSNHIVSSHCTSLYTNKALRKYHVELQKRNPVVVSISELSVSGLAEYGIVYGIPGGKTNTDENANSRSACEREIMEETGLQLNINDGEQLMLRKKYSYEDLPISTFSVSKYQRPSGGYTVRVMHHFFILLPSRQKP